MKKTLCWFLSLFCCNGLPISAQDSNQIFAEQIFHDQVFYDIAIVDGDRKDRLTNFRSWEYIADFALSRSEKYLYVWHKANQGAQLVITVYDVPNRKAISELAPGFGGDLFWTKDDKLIHVWGCGTGCYTFVVHDVFLKEIAVPNLGLDDIDGGYEISPQKDYVIFYSRVGYGYSILDLKEMKVVESQQDREGTLAASEFVEDYKIKIQMIDAFGKNSVRLIEIDDAR